MKKYVCVVLAVLTVALCSCQPAENVIKVYDQPYFIPSYMTRLYPLVSGDTRTALLLRRYDESASSIAVSPTPDGDPNVIYSLPEGTITYEVAANDGVIAFYELTVYSDGSVNYALKVIDTEADGVNVHSPYSKTVSEDNEIQTRFLCVFDGCVYYLTKSNLLGRCRVMKYSVKDKELGEYLGFDFTENEMTNNSSCTFISERSGYLTCGVVDGNRTTLKTYDLQTDKLVREKPLPYGAALVYMADHDYNTGMYAMYYLSAQSDERVAVFSYSEDDLTDVMTLDENTYVNREQVSLDGGTVYFETQNTDEKNDTPYKQFTGYIINAVDADAKTVSCPGCVDIFTHNGEKYALCFDEKQSYEKMILKKLTEKE